MTQILVNLGGGGAADSCSADTTKKRVHKKYLLWRVHVGRVFYLTGSVILGLSNHKLVFGVFEHSSSFG